MSKQEQRNWDSESEGSHMRKQSATQEHLFEPLYDSEFFFYDIVSHGSPLQHLSPYVSVAQMG